MYQDRTGCQWRYIPRDFPPSGTVRYYFDKWNDDGTMIDIHDCLRLAVREQQGRESEPTAIVIDSTLGTARRSSVGRIGPVTSGLGGAAPAGGALAGAPGAAGARVAGGMA